MVLKFYMYLPWPIIYQMAERIFEFLILTQVTPFFVSKSHPFFTETPFTPSNLNFFQKLKVGALSPLSQLSYPVFRIFIAVLCDLVARDE